MYNFSVHMGIWAILSLNFSMNSPCLNGHDTMSIRPVERKLLLVYTIQFYRNLSENQFLKMGLQVTSIRMSVVLELT